MFAAILSDLKRKEKQRKRFLPSVKRKRKRRKKRRKRKVNLLKLRKPLCDGRYIK